MHFNMSNGGDVGIELWDPRISPSYQWVLKVQTILEPFIIVLGILGNILATLVFMSKDLRVTSCCLYLAAKCVGDMIFLAALFFVWLYRIDIPLLNNHGICQITVFVSYACSFTSAWMIVLVSHENYVRIARPHQVKIYCTPRRAFINIAIVFTSGAVIYSFHLWTTQVLRADNSELLCMALARFHRLLVTINVLDLVVTLIIPVLLVAVLMLATLVAVIQALERKKRLTESLIGNGRCDSPRTETAEMKVAKFLTIVSLTLIILHSPSHVIRLKMLIASFVSVDEPSQLDYILQRIFEIMYYLNFSANLIIYAIAGEKFRKTLLEKISFKSYLHYKDTRSKRMDTKASRNNDPGQVVELTAINAACDVSAGDEGCFKDL